MSYQYKVECCPLSVAEEKMNNLGAEGWRVVSTAYHSTGVQMIIIVFERERTSCTDRGASTRINIRSNAARLSSPKKR